MPQKILIFFPAAYTFENTAFRRIKSITKGFLEYGLESIILSPLFFPEKNLMQALSLDPSCQIRLFLLRSSWLPGKLGKLLERILHRFLPWEKRSNPLFLEETYYQYGRKIFAEQKVDAILASFPTCHCIAPLIAAQRLAAENKIPLLFDFRDIPGEHGGIPQKELSKIYHFLKALSKPADLITTVSDDCALLLQKITGRNDIKVIWNGFDAETNNPTSKLPEKADVFRLIYPGALYDISMNLNIFWDALDLLASKIGVPTDIEIDFYLHWGSSLESISIYLESGRPGSKFVNLHGAIDHLSILELERSSAALLLFSYPMAAFDFFPSKAFEYLPMRRPILLVPDDHGLARKMLTETGYFCSFNTSQDIAIWIEEYYKEWKANDGKLRTANVNMDAIWKYSRDAQSAKMAKQISDTLQNK